MFCTGFIFASFLVYFFRRGKDWLGGGGRAAFNHLNLLKAVPDSPIMYI